MRGGVATADISGESYRTEEGTGGRRGSSVVEIALTTDTHHTVDATELSVISAVPPPYNG